MEKKLLADLEQSYGLRCGEITPVTGGWLNKKWKVSSSRGTLLVKQYSYERFTQKRLEQIESALLRQILLEENGIPCPHILTCQGRAIRYADADTAYMVMDYRTGKSENRETVTADQMESLGSVSALMRREFAKLPLSEVQGYPIDSRKFYGSLWDNFYARAAELTSDTPEEYKKAVLGQEIILKQLTPAFFDRLSRGIAHEDFTPDNMLFHTREVSAILDFDRNQYGFILHDIGRAFLSFALTEEGIDRGKVDAFWRGYTQYLPLTGEDIVDSLKIAWCVEVPWWIQAAVFSGGEEKIMRFKEEIVWVEKNWFELPALLGL